jgi:hypothetical protein
MRWPWVSRAKLHQAEQSAAVWERSQHHLVTQCESLLDFVRDKDARQERQEARFDALLEKYHALRLVGAGPAPDYAAIQHAVSPLATLGPLATAALREAAIGLPRLNQRAMEAKVLAMHANNVPDADIAAAIQSGEAVKIIA